MRRGAASAPGSRKRAHVVDDVRARITRRAHDFGLAGVDGDEHRRFAAQRFDDGNDTRELFVECCRCGAGPRRLTADVDDGRALLDHARARGSSAALAVDEAAAIGKGIGRDVENAHHHGFAEIEDPIPALPAERRLCSSRAGSAADFRELVLAGRRTDLGATVGFAFGALRRRIAHRIVPVGGRLRRAPCHDVLDLLSRRSSRT